MKEMEITGVSELGATESRWEPKRSVAEVNCMEVSVKPGEVRTFGLWLKWTCLFES